MFSTVVPSPGHTDCSFFLHRVTRVTRWHLCTSNLDFLLRIFDPLSLRPSIAFQFFIDCLSRECFLLDYTLQFYFLLNVMGTGNDVRGTAEWKHSPCVKQSYNKKACNSAFGFSKASQRNVIRYSQLMSPMHRKASDFRGHWALSEQAMSATHASTLATQQLVHCCTYYISLRSGLEIYDQ